MLITYTSIVHMIQAGFPSANIVHIAHLYYVIHQIGKNLTLETFKKELKKMNQNSFINTFTAYLR